MKLYAINIEFKYKRRQEPELSFGIEGFMFIFQLLSFLAVIMNIMIAYYTSTIYEEIFIKSDTYGFKWQPSNLLQTFVIVEHFLLFVKFAITISMYSADSEKNDTRSKNNNVYRTDMETKQEKRLDCIKKCQSDLSNILYRN